MVNKCCVPKCRGNYRNGPKVHAFSFPSNQDQRQKWLDALPPRTSLPGKHSKVCHLHFRPGEVEWESRAYDERSGRRLVVRLERPKLSPLAVPSVFPGQASILSSILAAGSPPGSSASSSSSSPEDCIPHPGSPSTPGDFKASTLPQGGATGGGGGQGLTTGAPQQTQQQQPPVSAAGGGSGGGIQQHSVTGSAGSPSPAPTAPKKSIPSAPAAPPEVCLRWNSYHSNMQATFPSLLNNEQFVDVTLACEGRSIKCHKVMLSACSSYFEELLSQNPCQHPIVFMRDLKFWEVQALVEFMYTGEVNVAQDKLPSLLTAAEALQIKGLTNPSSGNSYNAGGGSSHEEDSNTGPDLDDSTPLTPYHAAQLSSLQHHQQQPPIKRQRKRKSNNPTSYTQKTQVYSAAAAAAAAAVGSGGSVTGGPPGLAPMRLVQSAVLAQALTHHQQQAQSPPTSGPVRVKREPSPTTLTSHHRPPITSPMPPNAHNSHLPPPYVSIKSEPDDSCDTLLDLSDTDPSRKENSHGTMTPATVNHEPISLEQPGIRRNGSVEQQLKPTGDQQQDNGVSEDDEDEDPTGSECSEAQSMQVDPGEEPAEDT